MILDFFLAWMSYLVDQKHAFFRNVWTQMYEIIHPILKHFHYWHFRLGVTVPHCVWLDFHGFCWVAAVWAGSERVGWGIIFTRRDEDNSDIWSRCGGLTPRAGCCQAGSGLWGWCQACYSTALMAAGCCQRRPPLYTASADAIINSAVAAQASVSCFCSSHKYFRGQWPAIVRQLCCLYWAPRLRDGFFFLIYPLPCQYCTYHRKHTNVRFWGKIYSMNKESWKLP